jgi:hypothetical protein
VAEVVISVSEVRDSDDSLEDSEVVGVKVEVDVNVEVVDGSVVVEVVSGGVVGGVVVVSGVEVELLSFCLFIIAMASSRGSAATKAAKTKRRIANN